MSDQPKPIREEDLPTVENVQAIYRQVAESRAAFEKWISAPPIERSVQRCPNEPDKYAFAGQYDDYPVQLAWESWQESRNRREIAAQAMFGLLMYGNGNPSVGAMRYASEMLAELEKEKE